MMAWPSLLLWIMALLAPFLMAILGNYCGIKIYCDSFNLNLFEPPLLKLWEKFIICFPSKFLKKPTKRYMTWYLL